MTFPLENFDNLALEPQPSVIQGDPFDEIVEDLDNNYQLLESANGRIWTPSSGDAIHNAFQGFAYREFVLGLNFDARWLAGHPLWAVGADLRRAAQRNLIEPRAGELDQVLRRRIFTAEDKSPFGSLPYVRNIMHGASALVVDTGLVVTNNNQAFACYMLTSEDVNGLPSLNVSAIVQNALNKAEGQHQSQTYTLTDPIKIDYTVEATIFYDPNFPRIPTEAVLLTRARESLEAMMVSRRKLGYPIDIQDIEAALKVFGVRMSTVTVPADDLVPADESTYYYGTSHDIAIDTV